VGFVFSLSKPTISLGTCVALGIGAKPYLPTRFAPFVKLAFHTSFYYFSKTFLTFVNLKKVINLFTKA